MLLDLVEFGGAIATCFVGCLNNIDIAGLGIVTCGVGLGLCAAMVNKFRK